MQSTKLRDGAKNGGLAKTLTEVATVSPVKGACAGAQPPTLLTVGLSRWDTLSQFVPISRESWRKLVNSGRAPKAVKLSARCTMYSNAEVHRWLSDPAGYQA
jgi:prophage regulatory protein